MQKAILTWKDPSGPMTGVEISMRVSGAPNFTALSTVAKGVQKLEVPDLVDGTYEFRAVVVNGSKRSKDVTISGKVESVPGDVSDFAVAFE